MSAVGYCTLEDVRRALRKANLPGDIDQDNRIAIDAIVAETEPVEKSLKRHWYAPAGAGILNEADQIDIPTETRSRDDEYDIPTRSFLTTGSDDRSSYYPPTWVDYDPDDDPEPDYADMDGLSPKTVQGDYAAIELDRRDADAIEALHVRTTDGTYEDWVASDDYTEGSWPPSGEDYYLRVNNGGWSRLYLDVTNLLKTGKSDEYVLDSWANAVYLEWSYGHEGIPRNVRRAVALRAGAELVEDAVIEIPQNATVYNVETKAEKMREKADELLEVYR
ncbi:hypothetical protein Hbl1158_02920 [Halobaculum sp. CBA1158]|uniref:hypothetical protein n=1 Tax=Halobaculum sp. CBA1158 TaxID=2904243 RepID=UPI001F363F6C|nr:hypothetical protein [Halobaculum sp. CBA1158]UIP00339.1 hypothetical protein Hbl1158_02920 [Halobaculum sp. CBA1158]